MVADTLLQKLQEKYQEKLISVAIEGSTAKALDHSMSDLELRVLLEEKYDFHRWHAFFYREMFVGISYNAVQRTLDESKYIDYEWPISGDCILTSKVIYDPFHIYKELKENQIRAKQNADYHTLIL
ncbi:hypothetical protein NSQ26_01000 [Bacillus sp. FSL W7-1360]